ncbi:response regulator transcription factor [Pseudoflavitalea sp. G-6-1-2]|uniref:LytR/AlgR family response regulator transcription factor n=1 Tax=Pseudoflavitalea sp. G-6-1-2 TaxID=2728841 RepID=UPI00146F35D0|nr:LytTR family DNA-binding domain-containing protein [Pseudoflavitalea sp. G-6-1-2]NML23849.1 response regulator transcription factor [Pseudoflavitalea sp. G-6-1-2]
MALYNCVIADDEPIAREIVQGYCKHLPQLQVVASCTNALEAKAALQQYSVDILFLDINMPVLDGISFLKTLSHPPQVIFTTAYKEFAHSAFDLAACDYLLKPFGLDRFIIAVDKAIAALQRELQTATPAAAVADTGTEEALFIRSDNKIYRIPCADILYAEANGNYTKIVTRQTTYMPGITFSQFEQQLPKRLFVRVHRSFIINKTAISHLEGNRVFLQLIEIPVGSNYKDAFLKELGL